MIRLALLAVKIALFSVVVSYVLFPGFIDSKYGYLVALVVVLLVVLMAFDGLLAMKKAKNKKT